MKKISFLIVIFILYSIELYSWNNVYLRGDFNNWSSNAMYKQVGLMHDKWTFQWRGTTNGISLGELSYLEYKFDPEGDWGEDSLGVITGTPPDYGTNIIFLKKGESYNNIKKTNIKIGYPYIFALNADISPTNSSCELITNISFCGTNFFNIVGNSVTSGNWAPSDINNLMNSISITQFSKYIIISNSLFPVAFKFVPNRSWFSINGVSWAYGDIDGTVGPITNKGYAYAVDNSGNLYWSPKEKGVYNIYFEPISGYYEIKISGGHGKATNSITAIAPSHTINFTNFIISYSNLIKNVQLIIPSGWSTPSLSDISSSAGTIYLSGNIITVSNMNINKNSRGWIAIKNFTSPSTTGITYFTNKTESSNQKISHLYKLISGVSKVVIDTPPEFSNTDAQAHLTYGTNNLSVKLKSVESFTLSISYQDVDNDKPGYPGFGTNFIVLNIFTNSDYYGSLIVATNHQPVSYTTPYKFTFITTGTDHLKFSYQGFYDMTNTFSSLCSNYKVYYQWMAHSFTPANYEIFYPTNDLTWAPQINVDDFPPDMPSLVSIKSDEYLGNGIWIKWNKVTNSDLGFYIVEYGTNKSVNIKVTNVGYMTNTLLYPLLGNQLYYVRIKAYDNIGNFSTTSWYSNHTLNALPVLENPSAGSTVLFGDKNLSVKLSSSQLFTLKVRYRDIENDKPGYPGYGTNFILLNINTNNEYYGTIIVYTNGGTFDYKTGYDFTFTTTATELHQFSYEGAYYMTNSFYNLCANYRVSYSWVARSVGANVNTNIREILSTNSPLIVIDDTPPAIVNVSVLPGETKASLLWTHSTSTDLASSPYFLEWGESTNYGNSSGLISATNYTIDSLNRGVIYYYKLTIFDDVGNKNFVKGNFTTLVGVEGVSIDSINNVLASLNLPEGLNSDIVIESLKNKDAVALPAISERGEDVLFTYVSNEVTEIKVYNVAGEVVTTINSDNIESIGSSSLASLKSPDIGSGIYFAVYKDGSGNIKYVKFVYGVKDKNR